jgi:hypothetical protein
MALLSNPENQKNKLREEINNFISKLPEESYLGVFLLFFIKTINVMIILNY